MPRPVNRNAPAGSTIADMDAAPAPVSGWNTRDPITQMNPLFAPRLTNWFPSTASIVTRGGYTAWADGLGGPVETLFAYASPTAEVQLAAADGAIYDTSSGGTVGAPLKSGFNSDRWQYVNTSTAGGDFIIMVNGEDTPQKYNGSAVSDTVITGTNLTASDLVGINSYNNRLYFVEKGSLSFWYLDTNAIAGTATEFPLGTICQLGGYLMAMGTWTRDSGNGLENIAVFITSMGEIILYIGSDPGDVDNWTFLGRFVTGNPVGRRCLVNVAQDLVMITQDGFIPLSRVLTLNRADSALAFSGAINQTVVESVRMYGANYGWQSTLYSRRGMLVFNVPIDISVVTGSVARAEQYVANTVTGAWCRFTGQNAVCFGIYNERLYFGDQNGNIWLADNGSNDNGADIVADVSSAFQYFGGRAVVKTFTMVQPVLTADGDVQPAIEVNVDFEDKFPTAVPSASGGGASPWDTSPWDVTPWGGGDRAQKPWLSATAVGYAASVRMRIVSNVFPTECTAWNLMFKRGGRLSP